MIVEKFKQPLLFYFLASIFPSTFWLIAAFFSHAVSSGSSVLQTTFAFAGLLTPTLIALLIIYQEKELRYDLFDRIFNFKEVKSRYWFITFFLMMTSILLAQTISLFFGYSVDQFQFAKSFSFSSGIFPVWFQLIGVPAFEELAWHSYGTDSLRSRFNLFTTSVIFAVYWGIWHVPLSFIKDYHHNNCGETGILFSLNFLISLIPYVLIINWLYYKTNRNIVVTIIFHITAIYFKEIFCTHSVSLMIQTGLLALFSCCLIMNEKEFFFN